jgi:exoribonuclease R
MQYIIQIEERDYSDWNIIQEGEPAGEARPGPVGLPETFHPLPHRLFHGDVFKPYENGELNLICSPFRENQTPIPGVLLLENNKTYGRTENKKRLLYKCVPYDRTLPVFLVPYDIKMELSKHITNKYVAFKYTKWTEKHPYGELVETLGSVSTYSAFEQYQLLCKGLTSSITKYSQQIKKTLAQTSEETLINTITEKYKPEDRSQEYIFSIDNDTTTDYDDAMSITENLDGTTRISIYISNVIVWLQELDAWNTDNPRVSTIYLPTRKISMFPPDLSENLCSLIEKRERFAITMDYILLPNGKTHISISHTKIVVKKNYRYDAENLHKNPHYTRLLRITQQMDTSITNSHELVAYWMIKMNMEIGNILYKNNMGIFRLTGFPTSNTIISSNNSGDSGARHERRNWKFLRRNNGEVSQDERLDANTERILYNLQNHISSEYRIFTEGDTYTHSIMEIENYAHFTSPIRRLVDLLNQIYIWKLYGGFSGETTNAFRIIKDKYQYQKMYGFLNHWTSPTQQSRINSQMKAIRSTQTSCELLYICSQNTDMISRIYSGIILDTHPGLNNQIEYTVYISELKYLTRVPSTMAITLRSQVDCKIFTFQDKHRLVDKVVLQILEHKIDNNL